MMKKKRLRGGEGLTGPVKKVKKKDDEEERGRTRVGVKAEVKEQQKVSSTLLTILARIFDGDVILSVSS